ncbi:MAG TPA: Nramp family divalent metal transporter [Thermomicrobiales bacterium]|nr:Nramp family divalent metal transporter [Thermomicrobiales bacterium]
MRTAGSREAREIEPTPASDQPLADDLGRPRGMRGGLWLNIRGRSVRLRGLHRPPPGVLRWLAVLGPGFIAGVAGDDAGGIATYSSTGAAYGYELLWVLVLITVSLAVVQEMAARLGAATGRGLLDLIRERFGIGWALCAVSVILVANGALVVSEFVGIGAALELFGISKYIVVPLAALLVWYLVVAGNYARVEKVFVAMAVVFLAYPVAAVMSHPDWGAVARGAVIPRLHADTAELLLVVALIGTTLTPYQQLFQQSTVVEKGVARRHYGPERADTYVGALTSNLISAFIIIAVGATLFVAGKHDINTAADAAQALKPVAGDAATLLFAVGLLGASLLAAAVLPLATAYAVSEAFGFRKGVNLDFRRARFFLSLFTALVVVGAGIALIPHLPVIELLLGIQVLNGVMLPIMLVFIMLLANDRRLVGDLKNTRLYNILGWGTVALVTTAVVVSLASQVLSALGVM